MPVQCHLIRVLKQTGNTVNTLKSQYMKQGKVSQLQSKINDVDNPKVIYLTKISHFGIKDWKIKLYEQ